MGYDPTGEWTFSINLSFLAVCFGGAYDGWALSIDDNLNVALQHTQANVFEKILV